MKVPYLNERTRSGFGSLFGAITRTCVAPIACVALIFLASPAHAKKHKHSDKPEPAAPAPAPAPPTDPAERLSQFLNAHLDAIVAPLNAQGFNAPQQITDLRESFADEMAQTPPATKTVYQSAMAVCDALSQANDERGKVIASLSASTTVKGGSHLGGHRKDSPGFYQDQREQREAADRVAEASNTDSFFTSGQKSQWAVRATQLRQNIQQLYARQREIEREANAAAAAAAAAAPPAPAPASPAPASPAPASPAPASPAKAPGN